MMKASKFQYPKFTIRNLKFNPGKLFDSSLINLLSLSKGSSIKSIRNGNNSQSAIRNPQLKAICNHSSFPPSEGTFSQEDILAARLHVTKVLPYQQASPPFVNSLFLAVVSGFLLVFAFPNWGLWSLGWVGVAPLIMAVAREQKFWRSFWLGWTTGTIFYLGTSYWVTYSMHHYGGIPLWISYLIALLIAAIFGVFTALFAGVLGLAIKAFGGWAILTAPLLWAASEWLRFEVTGVGWNQLGYSQAFQPIIIQMAKLGGVYLVSAFLVAISAAVVYSLVYLGYRRGWLAFTIAGVLAIIVVLWGMWQIPIKSPRGSLNIIIVQPNVPINGDWGNEKFETEMLLRHIALTDSEITTFLNPEGKVDVNGVEQNSTTGAEKKRIDLVIWPESPMNFQYERDEKLKKRLAEFTRRHKVYLLINGWGEAKSGDAKDATYNSALLISPSGELISRYDKLALMPFGEYVPARGWIPFMDKIPALVADVTAGKDLALGEIADAKIGTMICFEATRPDLARRFRKAGASTIVQLSNESWFGPTAAARQVLAHAVFRAVENNIELIRVTNSGASAQITANGDVLNETPMFETATRVWSASSSDEMQNSPATVYTRLGDVLAIICAVLSAGLMIAAIIFERLKKKDEDND
ncbi:MAG: apolipoprotein N-acyltransferase [Acidobacteriota bacterium]